MPRQETALTSASGGNGEAGGHSFPSRARVSWLEQSGSRRDCFRISCQSCPHISARPIGVLEFQKLLHLLQCLVQRQLKGTAARPRSGEAQLVLQPAIDHLQIGPAQYLLAP
jgi:hypothetical protein